MTFLRKTLALSAVLAVAVALFGSFATTALAAGPPHTAYGTGATEGDAIAILAGTTSCATATADADGNWGPVALGATVGDCVFAAGDTISFSLNGTVAEQTETWAEGGAPADVATGTVLTVAAVVVPEVVPEVVVPEVVVPEVTAPAPGATGNAGLAQSTGTSSIATLLLSAFAVVVVAGGRVASRMR
jgi:hypothetical protein